VIRGPIRQSQLGIARRNNGGSGQGVIQVYHRLQKTAAGQHLFRTEFLSKPMEMIHFPGACNQSIASNETHNMAA